MAVEEGVHAMVDEQLVNWRAFRAVRRDSPSRAFGAESPRSILVLSSPLEIGGSPCTATYVRRPRNPASHMMGKDELVLGVTGCQNVCQPRVLFIAQRPVPLVLGLKGS